MTHRDDLDQMLTAWLDDPYTPPAPGYLGEVLDRTRRTRQRPAWASFERWLPMADKIARPALAPPLRVALILLIALLVAAIAVGVAVVGSGLLNPAPQSPRVQAPYPIPQGPSAVLVFDSSTESPSVRPGGDIYTIRADGTGLRQLTSGPVLESYPAWSPDGTRIAYLVGRDSLAVMDAGGRNQKTVVPPDPALGKCLGGSISWSPDGTSLLFPVSVACDDVYVLYVVAADGSSPAAKLLSSEIQSSAGAWSPDGKRIAFAGREPGGGTMALYVVDTGTAPLKGGLGPVRIISAAAGQGSNAAWMNPRWSPDGTAVAAAGGTNSDCRLATTGTLDAFVVKADGSGVRAVASEAAKEYNPAWSRDGRRLAFQRIVDASEYVNGRPCTMAIWVSDADGTNPRRLPGLGTDDFQPPFWSPDASRLVGNTVRVVNGIEHYDLYIVNADGTGPLVTVEDAGLASWQPLAAPLPPAPSFAPVSPTP